MYAPEPASFSGLPGELRNAVYGRVIQGSVLRLSLGQHGNVVGRRDDCGLAGACRQIRREYKPLQDAARLEAVIIHIHIDDLSDPEPLFKVLNTAQPSHPGQHRQINLRLKIVDAGRARQNLDRFVQALGVECHIAFDQELMCCAFKQPLVEWQIYFELEPDVQPLVQEFARQRWRRRVQVHHLSEIYAFKMLHGAFTAAAGPSDCTAQTELWTCAAVPPADLITLESS